MAIELFSHCVMSDAGDHLYTLLYLLTTYVLLFNGVLHHASGEAYQLYQIWDTHQVDDTVVHYIPGMGCGYGDLPIHTCSVFEQYTSHGRGDFG